MKFRLTKQHYDMKPDTVWFDAGPAQSPDGVDESRAVTKIKGDTSEGALRIVPITKLEVVDALDTEHITQ
jgi:hypothetical protein